MTLSSLTSLRVLNGAHIQAAVCVRVDGTHCLFVVVDWVGLGWIEESNAGDAVLK